MTLKRKLLVAAVALVALACAAVVAAVLLLRGSLMSGPQRVSCWRDRGQELMEVWSAHEDPAIALGGSAGGSLWLTAQRNTGEEPIWSARTPLVLRADGRAITRGRVDYEAHGSELGIRESVSVDIDDEELPRLAAARALELVVGRDHVAISPADADLFRGMTMGAVRCPR